VRLFCVCVVLCVGSGLATGSSPVQGVLPSAYRIKKLKSGEVLKKRAVEPIERERQKYSFTHTTQRVSQVAESVVLPSSLMNVKDLTTPLSIYPCLYSPFVGSWPLFGSLNFDTRGHCDRLTKSLFLAK
jgi:hypothetical protein